MSEHWKFLHAADLELGSSLAAGWLPNQQFRSQVLEAGYLALSRLVEVAIREQVDALLLAGNIVDPRTCGAHALGQLDAQFRRLSKGGIPVFWSLGHLDRRSHWPALPPWPENVTVFSEPSWSRHRLCSRDGRLLELAGRGWADSRGHRSWPASGEEGIPLVVLASVDPDQVPPAAQGTYWALGGTPTPRDLHRDSPVIRFAGALQPPVAEWGARGEATRVEIGGGGDVQWESVPLAPLVGLRRRYSCSAADDRGEFEALRAGLERDVVRLREELVREDASVETWLIEYRLRNVPPQLAWRLGDPVVRDRLLAQLPAPAEAPRAVPVNLVVETVQRPGQMPPEGTLLADLLRRLDQGAADPVFPAPGNAPWFSEFDSPDNDTLTSLSRAWAMAVIAESD